MHVPKGRAKVVKSTLAIQVAEALDGALKAENTEVEILDTGIVAHATNHGGQGQQEVTSTARG